MTVVSSKEFVSNEDKYFDLALNERVFIKKGNKMFFVTNADENENAADLALAKSRMNDEFTSSQDFRKFLKSLP